MQYSTGAQSIKTAGSWRSLLRVYITHVVIYSVIILGILLLADKYAQPWFGRHLGASYLADIALAIVTITVLAPFLWALALRKIQPEAVNSLGTDKRHKGPLLMLQLLRFALALFFIGMLINNLLSSYAAIGALVLVLATFVLNQKVLQSLFNRIESRFISNYNDKEERQEQEEGTHLAPWDAHISSFVVNPEFSGVGKSLIELHLRESLGINIAMIRRGKHTINLPDRTERLYPDDVLFVIGTDEQLEAFRLYLEQNLIGVHGDHKTEQEITLQQLEIRAGSEFIGKTIRESGVRDQARGMIVGIERGGNRMLNPESNVVLMEGDVIWIVGNPRRIKLLSSRQAPGMPQPRIAL